MARIYKEDLSGTRIPLAKLVTHFAKLEIDFDPELFQVVSKNNHIYSLPQIKRERKSLSLAVLNALVSRHFIISSLSPHTEGVRAILQDHYLSIKLRQRYVRDRRSLNEKEQGHPSANTRKSTYETKPTNDFALKIEGAFNTRIQKLFYFETASSFQEMSGNFLDTCEAAINNIRDREAEQLRRQQDFAKLELERLAHQHDTQRRASHRVHLLRLSEDWKTAETLRSFLALVRAAGPGTSDPKVWSAWLQWAEREATDLDPLTNEMVERSFREYDGSRDREAGDSPTG